MPRHIFTAYTDGKGKPVLQQTVLLQQNKPDRWELVGIYGQVDAADARRLHAALGELLTDLAAEGKMPAEEKAEEPAVI